MNAPTSIKNALLISLAAVTVLGLLVHGVVNADQLSVADQGLRDEQPDPHLSTGISGYSGNPATNGGSTCTACHSGGTAPTVTLSGPTVVAPGEVNTYSLTISGGQEIAGGLDVSATDGSLAATDPDTQLLDGEIAHTVPRPVDGSLEVVWDFDWTAPMIPGPVTLYGAGNSVNLAQGTNGDNASSDTLEITVSSGTALFRVNAGGPLVAALDAGPDWSEDTGANPSPFHNPGSTAAGFAVGSVDASVPATTPIDIFQTERWDPVGDPEMSWTFPVGAAGTYEVRLYLANGCGCTQNAGDRIFDVAIEGALVLDDYDIVADVGHLVGTMKSFVVTSDADLNIDFTHNVENPLVNGIEILAVDANGFLTTFPTSLSFGLVEINTSSTPQSVTLTNLGQAGDADITISNVAVSGEFNHNLAFPQVLTPGQSTAFDVTFDPTLVGAAVGTLTIDHDGNNTPTTIGLSGEGFDPGSPPISFGASNLVGESSGNPTSLQFGPDDRLYVAQQNGTVFAYTIVRNGPDDYQVTATEQIDLVKNIPNHQDDGTLNAVNNRQVTGLLATACPGGAAWCIPGNTVLYVSSSDPRIGAGGGGNDVNLDTNSGIISRLAWNGASWDHVQIVRGLPRSEENHSTNGMALDAVTNTLYVMSGGHDNKGAPSNNFAATPEYALSAAMLSVDLDAIETLPTQTDAQGQDFIYDIPTLDDPTRGTPGQPDPDDPFGGNDGRNQARIVPGGPVQIYSPGYRNPYDVVQTAGGKLYTFDNGPNTGWGGIPIGEGTSTCTNELNEATSTGFGDGLHFVSGPGYYGGHPHPTRANPTGSGLFVYENQAGTWVQIEAYDWQVDFPDPPVPFADANPVECDYQIPGVENGALAVIGASTNGIAEYSASNFGGAMVGDLLAAAFNGNIWRFELNAAGDQVTNQEVLFSGFGSQPLDVIAQGDGDVFPGSVWVAVYGSGTIAVFEPIDFGPCTGADDPGLDEDNDGYSNADEIDNGTDPCSAGSQPPDNDGDLISDLNDDDDDNDGILDPVDEFAIDADNGTTTNLPVLYPFFNFDPGTGFFGLGFTGLMVNGTTDYLTQFDEAQINAGGAGGLLGIEQVTLGDAFQATNTQDNAFQFGVNVDTSTPVFSVQTRVNSPYFEVGGNPTTPIDFQSFGMFIGTGDQDNYLKVVFNAQSGAGGIEVLLETGGTASSTNYSTAVVGDILNSIFADLFVTVDPTAGTVQPAVSLDGGAIVPLGAPLSIPSSWLDAGDSKGLAVGVISTAFGSGQPFGAIWDFIEVTPGPAGVECTVDADCDDGLFCTGTETCDLGTGTCVAGTPPVCPDDGVACTDEICDPGTDSCTSVPNDANCADDGLFCTGPEVCDAVSDCISQGDPCTGPGETCDEINDVCAALEGFCVVPPAGDADCDGLDDGTNDPCVGAPGLTNTLNRCSGTESALCGTAPPGTQDCEPGLELRLDPPLTDTDGPPISSTTVCTGEAWYAETPGSGNSFAGNVPAHTAGVQGLFGCTDAATEGLVLSERWLAGTLSRAYPIANGEYVVNLLFSEGSSGQCAAGARIFDIDVEGASLVGFEQYAAALAENGVACGSPVVRSFRVDVLDGVLNIDLSIGAANNPALKGLEVRQIVTACTIDADCDDLEFCNGVETCNTGTGLCEVGTPPDCTDAVSCTVDTCNEATDGCDNTPSDALCNNGLFCDGDETCDAALDCQSGTAPCVVPQTCDEVGDVCLDPVCTVDADCDDSDPCTQDTCNVGTGQCTNVFVDADNDGLGDGDATCGDPCPGQPLNDCYGPVAVDGTTGNDIRINAFGTTVQTGKTDCNGDFWVADFGFNTPPGGAGACNLPDSCPIAGITDIFGCTDLETEEIFQFEHWDPPADPELEYSFDVANGDYLVNLLFANTYTETATPGTRVFDILVEGAVVYAGFDQVAAAGGSGTAVVRSALVTVSDGDGLQISFAHGVENPTVKGIEVLALPGSVTCYVDGDGDGFGAGAGTEDPDGECDAGSVDNADDCDDTSATTFPGSAPNEADPAACYADADDDGYGDTLPPAGVTPGTDCNDGDAGINPGATEIPGNGVDEDCDGFDAVTCYVDGDGDGFGAGAGTVDPDGECDAGSVDNADDCDDTSATTFPGSAPNEADPAACYADADDDGYGDALPPAGVTPGTDCNDGDAGINPGATEIPGNGVDEDCDGFDAVTCYVDGDGDGFGAGAGTVDPDGECDAGTVDNADDCDDTSATTFPGSAPNEADPAACYADADDDGYGDDTPPAGVTPGTDCDDGDAGINPGATEIPGNTVDENCDGFDAVVCYVDGDGDGFGAGSGTPDPDGECDPGTVDNADDCDDTSGTTFPGSAPNEADPTACYADADDDGYGDTLPPAGVTPGTDCNDGDAGINPGATEIPGNGVDEDCDGFDAVTCYVDGDGDGFGAGSGTPDPDGECDAGTVDNADDCDDTSGTTFPGSAPNEADPAACYADADDDGYGDTLPPAGVTPGTDCNDGDAAINPGATEIPGNGVDEDCDGFDAVTCYVDGDGDGFGAGAGTVDPDGECDAGSVDNADDCDDTSATTFPGSAPNEADPAACYADADDDGYGDTLPPAGVTPGTDCNDGDAGINPGATEIPGNGVDEDCDGFDAVTCYVDGDGDGFGAGAGTVDPDGECDAGTVDNADDCDDNNNVVFPGAPEVCDAVDNNCDGNLDDAEATASCDDGNTCTTNTCTPAGVCDATASGDCSLSGLVFYYRNATGEEPGDPGFTEGGVPDVPVSLSGTVNGSTTTDPGGNYTLGDVFGDVSVVAGPRLDEVIDPAVGSLDASRIAQEVVGIVTLTPRQGIAADVTGNGTITSFDASFVSRYAVNLVKPLGSPDAAAEHFPVAESASSDWTFLPLAQEFNSVSGDVTADFEAILYGDVTGNWPALPLASADNQLGQSASPGSIQEPGADATSSSTASPPATGSGPRGPDRPAGLYVAEGPQRIPGTKTWKIVLGLNDADGIQGLDVVIRHAGMPWKVTQVNAVGLASGLNLLTNDLGEEMKGALYGVTSMQGSGAFLELALEGDAAALGLLRQAISIEANEGAIPLQWQGGASLRSERPGR